MKKIIVLAVIALVVLAPLALAKKPDNPGKGKGLGEDEASVSQGKPDKAVGRGAGQGRGNQATMAVGEESEADDIEDENGADEESPQKKGKGKEKETQGRLVSTAQQVRREQFEILREELRDLGYHGPMNDFVISFNRQINQLKDEIKGKVNTSTDVNFTQAIVREVAERELARIREERIANLNVSDENVSDALKELIEDKSGEGNDSDSNFTSAIKSMNTEFKNMIVDIAKNGSPAEKRNLRSQIRDYRESRKNRIHSMIAEKIATQRLDHSGLREKLKQHTPLDQIIEEVE